MQFPYNFVYFMLCGVVGMVVYNMPIFMGQVSSMQLYSSVFEAFVGMVASFTTGVLVSAGYDLKNKKDYKEIFNKFNNDLGEEAISQFSFYGEDEILSANLKKVIDEIVTIRLELEIQKTLRENLILKSERALGENDKLSRINQKTIQENEDLEKGKSLKRVLKK